MPSVAAGIARVFDLWGAFDYYNYSSSPEEADAKAMFGDWYAVGQDLRKAEAELDSEHSKKEAKVPQGPRPQYART